MSYENFTFDEKSTIASEVAFDDKSRQILRGLQDLEAQLNNLGQWTGEAKLRYEMHRNQWQQGAAGMSSALSAAMNALIEVRTQIMRAEATVEASF